MNHQQKDWLIEELIEACQFTLTTYNNITSDDFRLGKDKPARDRLETILATAADYEIQALAESLK